MKTGMEWALLGVVVLVALGFLWNIWSGMQLDIAVAATTATAAGTTVPAPVMVGGQWIVNAIVGTVIGGAVSAFIAALVIWVRKRWSEANQVQQAHAWQGGPNARWGKQPRVPSEAELMRMALLQQMASSRSSPRPTIRMEVENEPEINI
jgi:hypothetical protein